LIMASLWSRAPERPFKMIADAAAEVVEFVSAPAEDRPAFGKKGSRPSRGLDGMVKTDRGTALLAVTGASNPDFFAAGSEGTDAVAARRITAAMEADEVKWNRVFME